MKRIEKSALVTVMAVSTVLLGACSRSGSSVRVCADGSNWRVPDVDCQNGGSGGRGWVYLNSGYAPPVGSQLSEGSHTPRSGVRYGLAPEGGISRGGFGSTGEGFGAHGFGE